MQFLTRPKIVFGIFTVLVFSTLLTPLVYWTNWLYPLIATKAVWLRITVELTLPFFVALLFIYPQHRPNLRNPLNLVVLLSAVVTLISGLLGQDVLRSFLGNFERMDGVFEYFHLVLFYFYLLLLGAMAPMLLEKFLRGVVWVSLVACVYAIWVGLGLPKLFIDVDSTRASSFFGNPIFFASFLVIPAALSLFFAIQQKKRTVQWWFYWVTFVLHWLVMYMTSTRGLTVALGLGTVILLGLYLILSHNRRAKVISGIILALILMLGIGLYSIRGVLPKQSRVHRLTNLIDTNARARLIEWGVAWKGFLEHPILGVGSENFNIIANKHFDVRMYKYDSSWFDKPHNYPLEILTTQGIIGFGVFIALQVILVRLLWGLYKRGRLNITEWLVILGAWLVYQLQNLFVFDTVSAAWTNIILIAMIGVWANDGEPSLQKVKSKLLNTYGVLAYAGAGILVVVIFWIWHIPTMRLLNDIDFGYAIDVKNAPLAENYYETAISIPWNFDKGELGAKYEEFAVRVVQGSTDPKNADFVHLVLGNALQTLESATKQHPKNPIYWYKLGNLYNVQARYDKTFDPRAELVINKSIELAPNRLEPLYFLVQTKALANDIPETIRLSELAVAKVPDNPLAHWRLAFTYKDAGRLDDAVREAQAAELLGYKFDRYAEFQWYINYFVDRENYQEVVRLYEIATGLSPDNDQVWEGLAAGYAKLGRIDDAIKAANQVAKLKPERAMDVKAFIEMLQSQK